jgi:glycine/D-amino acid oxidase-like deaminating enzyme
VYSQCVDPGRLSYRAEVSPGVWVVTGPGGRGMTLGPVIGEITANKIGL